MITTLEKYIHIDKEIETKGKLSELKEKMGEWGQNGEMGQAIRGDVGKETVI